MNALDSHVLNGHIHVHVHNYIHVHVHVYIIEYTFVYTLFPKIEYLPNECHNIGARSGRTSLFLLEMIIKEYKYMYHSQSGNETKWTQSLYMYIHNLLKVQM